MNGATITAVALDLHVDNVVGSEVFPERYDAGRGLSPERARMEPLERFEATRHTPAGQAG